MEPKWGTHVKLLNFKSSKQAASVADSDAWLWTTNRANSKCKQLSCIKSRQKLTGITFMTIQDDRWHGIWQSMLLTSDWLRKIATHIPNQCLKVSVPIHSLTPHLFPPNIWRFWYQKLSYIEMALCVKQHMQNLQSLWEISEKCSWRFRKCGYHYL